MSQAQIGRFGQYLSAGLIFAGGVFYHVRRGAVRFVRCRDQERMRRTYGLTFRMARAAEQPFVATVRPVIQPARGGRAGVADFLAYYNRTVQPA